MLSRLAAVLYYVLRVRYCLSVLVYAGVSLFILVGPYLYLVVCVIYAYNLAWGGLKNGKNGGEPNGFWLVFVMRKNNFGILGNFKERSTFKFCFISGDFLLLIPPFLFTVHIRLVLSPCQAGNTCCILSCFFKYVYNRINTICTHNMYIVYCLAPLFLFWDHRILLDFLLYQYNIIDTLIMVQTSFII